MVRPVARDHVPGEQDGLRFRQVVAGAQLPALSGLQGPQQDRGRHEAVGVDPVHPAIEALEERRADPDAARSLEGHVAGRVGRGAPPLRRHELDRGVARLRPMGEVVLPLLVGRLEGAVPGRAGGPEERRAVRVGEVVGPPRTHDRAPSIDRLRTGRRSAHEGPPHSVEAGVRRVGAVRLPGPRALLVRREAHLEEARAVPEARDGASAAGRGDEADREALEIVKGVVVADGALEGSLEAPPPLDPLGPGGRRRHVAGRPPGRQPAESHDRDGGEASGHRVLREEPILSRRRGSRVHA